nr:translation initiation factor IF-2-like [Anser cygnoides]
MVIKFPTEQCIIEKHVAIEAPRCCGCTPRGRLTPLLSAGPDPRRGCVTTHTLLTAYLQTSISSLPASGCRSAPKHGCRLPPAPRAAAGRLRGPPAGVKGRGPAAGLLPARGSPAAGAPAPWPRSLPEASPGGRGAPGAVTWLPAAPQARARRRRPLAAAGRPQAQPQPQPGAPCRARLRREEEEEKETARVRDSSCPELLCVKPKMLGSLPRPGLPAPLFAAAGARHAGLGAEGQRAVSAPAPSQQTGEMEIPR